jgi:hypothetical protein
LFKRIEVHWLSPFEAADALTMARIADLRTVGNAGHDSTTESKPQSATPNSCEAICEGLSVFPRESENFWRFETSTAHHSTLQISFGASQTQFNTIKTGFMQKIRNWKFLSAI